MIVLLAIGFLAGVITAVSPCVLPVLPILLAGGAAGGRRRSYAIIAGLVASFTLFTLTASAILSALGLPQDFLRNAAIALLFLLAATLLVPRLGLLVERPFAFLSRRRGNSPAGGLLLGASLGLVFVPCAGPVLATISVLSAQHRIGFQTVLLTLAYALGAAVPMLLVALGGASAGRRLRAHGLALRRAMGAIIALAAVAIVFNVDRSAQTALGSYTTAIQKHVESTSLATRKLDELRGVKSRAGETGGSQLSNLGQAPDFTGISHWLNTNGDRPLTLASLRGKVVLVDFWTYSCINCIRTLPHLRSWYATYHRYGFEIVGVHTPEFAFEHVLSNVRGATRDLGVTWPVALDNGYATWNAYRNQYWPAEYLIDAGGRLRRAHFGEGDYPQTEAAIRALLIARGASLPKAPLGVPDLTPREQTTPESYLGYERLAGYAGTTIRPDRVASYAFPPALAADQLSYAGRWRIGAQRAFAVRDARLRLHVRARDVYLVLGGKGRVESFLNGKRLGTIAVTGDRLYTVLSGASYRDALLELRFAPGVSAFAFTFG